MTGHTALIGDDRPDPPHRRNHIGVGHLGDEDVAVLDCSRILHVADDGHSAAADAGRGTLPFEQNRPEFAAFLFAGERYLGTLDGRYRAGLQDEEFSIHNRPLDILRDTVVVFCDLPEHGEACHFVVGEYRCNALLRRQVDDLRPLPAVREDGDLFLRDQAVDDTLRAQVKDVFVGRDAARYHSLAKAPRSFDDRQGFTGDRMRREEDAGLLGRDELLDDHRDIDRPVVESLL